MIRIRTVEFHQGRKSSCVSGEIQSLCKSLGYITERSAFAHAENAKNINGRLFFPIPSPLDGDGREEGARPHDPDPRLLSPVPGRDRDDDDHASAMAVLEDSVSSIPQQVLWVGFPSVGVYADVWSASRRSPTSRVAAANRP